MNRRRQTLRRGVRALLLFTAVLTGAAGASAQGPSPSPSPTPQVSPTPSLEKRFFKNILRDQRAIWTSPFHLSRGDAKWAVPLGLSTAALLATDQETDEFGSNRRRTSVSRDVSLAGSTYGTAGVAAAFYLAGRATGNMRARNGTPRWRGAHRRRDSLLRAEERRSKTTPRPRRRAGRVLRGGALISVGARDQRMGARHGRRQRIQTPPPRAGRRLRARHGGQHLALHGAQSLPLGRAGRERHRLRHRAIRLQDIPRPGSRLGRRADDTAHTVKAISSNRAAIQPRRAYLRDDTRLGLLINWANNIVDSPEG